MRKLLLALLCCVAMPALAQISSFTFPSNLAANAFTPTAKTSWLASTSSTANIALALAAQQVQVFNAGTVPAFVNCGVGSGVTASAGTAGASTTDYPVAPGATVVFTVPVGTTYCASVSSSAAAVYFTPGIGL